MIGLDLRSPTTRIKNHRDSGLTNLARNTALSYVV